MARKEHYKPDTLDARAKAAEAVDAYLRLAWRDACTPEEMRDWTDEQTEEADISEKHLVRWLAVGVYEPLLRDPSEKPGAMYLNGDSGISPDMFHGMLAIAADS